MQDSRKPTHLGPHMDKLCLTQTLPFSTHISGPLKTCANLSWAQNAFVSKNVKSFDILKPERCNEIAKNMCHD